MVQSEKTILLEESSLKSKELFDKFASYKETGAVLLGVLGGSFSEGIDFCGDLLKGVVVVGLPLAPPDLQTRELITYYDRMYSKGWDYGYTIPALIKSVQSAGRCIRSSTDKGVIVFLDERYTWRGYYDSFPKDWKIVIDREPGTRVKKFFENIIK
jgi:DNA excision repair protein ERCC-2